MAEKYGTQWWRTTLLEMGVRMQDAVVWAPALSRFMIPASFSAGEVEIPKLMGQALYETQMLRRLEEDLDYSADRLMAVWPGRFPTRQLAEQYAHAPEKLAGFVYGNRLGNTSDADGWDYRGSGIPMITGKANYQLVQNRTGIPLVAHPQLLRTDPLTIVRCAIAWWEKNIEDQILPDTQRVSEVVSGGDLGLAQRLAITEHLERIVAREESTNVASESIAGA